MSIIIDDPADPFDVKAWESRIALLRSRRESLDPITYEALLGSLQSGLEMAQRGPGTGERKFKSLRERLTPQ